MLETFKSTEKRQRKWNMVVGLPEIIRLYQLQMPLEMPLFFYKCIFVPNFKHMQQEVLR